MRSFRLLGLLCVLLIAGGTSRALAVANINDYAGTYQSSFYLKLNSGDFMLYGVILEVHRGKNTDATLDIKLKVASQNVATYGVGVVDKEGRFSVIQTPGQNVGAHLRTLSIGGRLRYKLNQVGSKSVFQFSNPGNNLGSALDAATQYGLMTTFIKVSDK